jgi:hypothetical protein
LIDGCGKKETRRHRATDASEKTQPKIFLETT